MRHAVHPSVESRAQISMSPTAVSFVLGWDTLLSDTHDMVAVGKKAVGRCPDFQENTPDCRMEYMDLRYGRLASAKVTNSETSKSKSHGR